MRQMRRHFVVFSEFNGTSCARLVKPKRSTIVRTVFAYVG